PGCRERATALSAYPAGWRDYRSYLRDPVSRSRRRSLRLHLRVSFGDLTSTDGVPKARHEGALPPESSLTGGISRRNPPRSLYSQKPRPNARGDLCRPQISTDARVG